MLIANQRGQITTHLAELNSTKDDVTRLQQQVISATIVECIDIDDQIVERLSTAVQSSVETGNSKNYSDVVKSSAVFTSAVIPRDTIKSVAQKIAVEEELSRNIMVFGLTEEEDEQLDERVAEIFEQLGEKPRVESRQLGQKKWNSAV